MDEAMQSVENTLLVHGKVAHLFRSQFKFMADKVSLRCILAVVAVDFFYLHYEFSIKIQKGNLAAK